MGTNRPRCRGESAKGRTNQEANQPGTWGKSARGQKKPEGEKARGESAKRRNRKGA